MGKVGVRSRWLVHPLFLGAVAVLFVNDHILKAWAPGWWTGKLSDVAGVVVVAVLLSVALGAQVGVSITAAGFAALKLLPGVAELTTPLLGGQTMRDSSDLLALGVLPPLWWWLSRSGRRDETVARVRVESQSKVHWSALGAATLPVVSLCVAMIVTTATTCAPDPAVIAVATEGDSVLARISDGGFETQWARSDDAGRSWVESPPAESAATGDEEPADYYGENESLGPTESCTDQVCFRIANRRVIERTSDGQSPVAVFELTDAQFADISTGCRVPQRGVLTSISATGTADGAGAVASLGAEGVVVIWADGEAMRVPVLDARPPDPPPSRALVLVELAFGPVLAALIWLTRRNRWPSWRAAVLVAIIGWLASASITGAAAFFEIPRAEWWFAAMLAVTLVVTVAVGRNEKFSRPAVTPPSPPTDLTPS